jgi:hypothetical protein
MIDPPCKSGSEGNEELSLVPQSDFCGECSKCAQAKARTSRPWTALQPNMPPIKPFTHYSLDFIFGLPKVGPLQHPNLPTVCFVVF